MSKKNNDVMTCTKRLDRSVVKHMVVTPERLRSMTMRVLPFLAAANPSGTSRGAGTGGRGRVDLQAGLFHTHSHQSGMFGDPWDTSACMAMCKIGPSAERYI